MRHSIPILILLFSFSECHGQLIKKNTSNLKVFFNCSKGKMSQAWYEHGKDETVANIKELKKEFLILVDTNLKSINFISFDEQCLNRKSLDLDTSDLNFRDNCNNLSVIQKFKVLEQEKLSNKKQAIAVHLANNQRQQQVWIINNSNDTVSIQMQDWSFVCVLQALTKEGNWSSIQYWRFSNCGNSYYSKEFLPNTANSFITNLPNKGDFKTKLRYKLLGKDRFYYSNEFDGKINYCEFIEEGLNYKHNTYNGRPHYKLDRFINLKRDY